MQLSEFKSIVDRCTATITTGGLADAYQTLNIPSSNGMSSFAISDRLYKNIREALEREGDAETVSKNRFYCFQKELIYRYVLFGEDPVEYLKVISVIRDACRQGNNSFAPLSETQCWITAITDAKNYNAFHPATFALSVERLRKNYAKEFDIAVSVNQLRDKGCQISIVDSDLVIESGLEHVIGELDKKIAALGGITLIARIFGSLGQSGNYSSSMQRYFVNRRAGSVSFDQQPQIPMGYLVNLAAKYPYEHQTGKFGQRSIDEIVELAIMISNGAYGVQHYNMWEFHFHTGETIIEFCRELALWDTMFNIPQAKPSTIIDICKHLFSFISAEKFRSFLGFSLADFISVASLIFKESEGVHMPMIIYHSKVCKALKTITPDTIQAILDFLSHAGHVNKNFLLPSDYPNIDFWKKPLLKLGQTKFLLLNRSVCAPNIFECLVMSLRQCFKDEKKDLDKELGKQLEYYLNRKMAEKGITSITGEYKVNGKEGESDLIVESDKAITLFEFKKKILTGKAKSGDDVHILLDLADSLLSAQLQAGRTEILLRQNGELRIKDSDRKSYELLWKNRTIERMALSHLEFGAFQDRTITVEILRSLVTHSFGTYSQDEKIKEKFAALEIKRSKLVEQYNALYQLDPSFKKAPFYNCWFMSLAQLMEVIERSSDNNSFYELLSATKYVTFHTLDWYKEFDIMMRAKANAPAS